MAKIPRTVYVVLIPSAILFNVILILVGIFSFLEGALEIAITLWVLTGILDIFIIIGIIYLIKFHEKVQPYHPAPADPTCLIFLPFLIGTILTITVVSMIFL